MTKGFMYSVLAAGWVLASGAYAEDTKPAAAPAATTTAPADAKKNEPKKDEPKKEAAKKEEPKKEEPKIVESKKDAGGPTVEVKTSEGSFKIQLDEKAAPESVKNFVQYVNEKFYDGTVFHRVISKFMIQGGGFASEGGKLNEKKTRAAIPNEGKNGLKNERGTIAMARTSDPNSATAQFFVNLVNNDRLNYPQPDGFGYAVFGKVVEGMDVVDKIAGAKTTMKSGMGDVPEKDIVIQSITLVKTAS